MCCSFNSVVLHEKLTNFDVVVFYLVFCVTAGKIPALEDTVCLRFKEHIVITVEPSQERTVSP